MLAVAGTETNMQKDRLALSAMLATIPQTSGVQLDIKKLAKVKKRKLSEENSKNLSTKKTEKVSKYTDKFSRIVFELRQLGEKIEDKEAVKKLHQSMPPRYDSLTLSLENLVTSMSCH